MSLSSEAQLVPVPAQASVLIARVARVVRHRFEQVLTPLGLSQRDVIALSYLRGHGPTPQQLLAEQLHLLGDGWRLIRREYPTPIGPVDIMCRDDSGEHVAVEMKRHATIDAVEQLTRYLELLNRDPLLTPVHGILAAQTIKLQARTLAEDRGIRCVVLDYDTMRGIEREGTLF